MRVGDLLGSGTISGANRDNCGSMLRYLGVEVSRLPMIMANKDAF